MNEGSTHWEGCWREHHECAVAEIERLTAYIDLAGEGEYNILALLDLYQDRANEAEHRMRQMQATFNAMLGGSTEKVT